MRLAAATLAMLLTGCAATQMQAPNLSVMSVEMQQSEMFEQRFKVHLRVQNPNDRDLPVRGISAQLDLNGEKFANGVSAASFTVPAFGEAEFDMMMSANLAGAILRMASSMKGGKTPESFDYRIRGKVNLQSGVMRTIPFDRSGSFNLGDLRPSAPATP